MRRLFVVSAVAAVGLAFAGAAQAATVGVVSDQLTYTAAPGEVNNVTLRYNCPWWQPCSSPPGVRISDPGQDIQTGNGCTTVGPGEVSCVGSAPNRGGMKLITVNLGDQADRFGADTLSPDLVVRGQEGADQLQSNLVGDLDGGPGDDSLTLTSVFIIPGLITSGSRLTGGPGDDVLTDASAGSNALLDGGPGADKLDGSAVDYSSRTAPVTVDLDGLPDDGEAGEGDLVSPRVQWIIGGAGDDTLALAPLGPTGGTVDEDLAIGFMRGIIEGGAGNDRIVGSEARDVIHPGQGSDVIHMGAGNDWIDARDLDDAVDTIDCGADSDEAHLDATDEATNCETIRRKVRDTARPSSQATAPSLATDDFTISYTTSDPAPSSGLARVELWLKEPGAAAYSKIADDGSGQDTGTFTFTPRKEGSHPFYTIAVDRSGNVEAAPSTPDATTRVDLTNPTIAAYSPTGSAVKDSTKVTVRWSEEMDKPSAQQAFALVRVSNGAAVSGSFSWNGTTMTFAPGAKLARKTTYEARVATTARDLAGRALAAPFSWRFTTN